MSITTIAYFQKPENIRKIEARLKLGAMVMQLSREARISIKPKGGDPCIITYWKQEPWRMWHKFVFWPSKGRFKDCICRDNLYCPFTYHLARKMGWLYHASGILPLSKWFQIGPWLMGRVEMREEGNVMRIRDNYNSFVMPFEDAIKVSRLVGEMTKLANLVSYKGCTEYSKLKKIIDRCISNTLETDSGRLKGVSGNGNRYWED